MVSFENEIIDIDLNLTKWFFYLSQAVHNQTYQKDDGDESSANLRVSVCCGGPQRGDPCLEGYDANGHFNQVPDILDGILQLHGKHVSPNDSPAQ